MTDLASPYVVCPCLHAQWSHILGLVRGGDKDLSQGVNKPVRVGGVSQIWIRTIKALGVVGVSQM